MRYATVITFFKKRGRETHNAIVQSIITADDKKQASLKAMGSITVSEYLQDGYKVFWNKAIEIPDKTPISSIKTQ